MNDKNEKHVEVISEFKFDPQFVEHAKKAIFHVIAPSRSEPGCWHYDFFENPEEPNQFIMVELWANKSAWENHLEQPHIKKCIAIIEAYLLEPIKTRWFYPVEMNAA